MRNFLLSAFCALQLGDVLSTNRFLSNGTAAEGNPIVATVIAHMGTAWWLPKLALCLLMVVCCRRADIRAVVPAVTVVNCVYASVVANNLYVG